MQHTHPDWSETCRPQILQTAVASTSLAPKPSFPWTELSVRLPGHSAEALPVSNDYQHGFLRLAEDISPFGSSSAHDLPNVPGSQTGSFRLARRLCETMPHHERLVGTFQTVHSLGVYHFSRVVGLHRRTVSSGEAEHLYKSSCIPSNPLFFPPPIFYRLPCRPLP